MPSVSIMKVYISADIEGIAGVSHWEEASGTGTGYQESRQLMTQEVLAACQGAFEAGAEEVVIKDAHASGRNIITSQLPEKVRIVRGWSGHPYAMMQELDGSFDAAMLIGYHSSTTKENNPLGHTLKSKIGHLKINGHFASEFLLNAYTAALVQVPVVLLSGDAAICEEATALNENMQTVAVSRGTGASTMSLSPRQAGREIQGAASKALRADISQCRVDLPDRFHVEITFTDPTSAYRASFYPGVKKGDPQTVLFETNDYFDVLRMLIFIL